MLAGLDFQKGEEAGDTRKRLPAGAMDLIYQLGQEVSCPICLGLLANAVTTLCNHVYCQDCIGKMMRVSQSTAIQCPICKSRVTRRSLCHANGIQRVAEGFVDVSRIFEKYAGGNCESSEYYGRGSRGVYVCISSSPTRKIDELLRVNTSLSCELAEAENFILEKDTRGSPGFLQKETFSPLDQSDFLSSDDVFGKTVDPKMIDPGGDFWSAGDVDRKVVIATSLVEGEATDRISKAASKLGWTVQSKFDGSVTHLVMPITDRVVKRTLKYLRAILSGCWIVSVHWAEQCARRGILIEEEEFETQGDEYFGRDQGPKRARLSKLNNESPLFSGYSFFLYGLFAAPPAGDLELLIREGGGGMVRDTDSLAKCRGKVIVLCDPNEQSDFEKDGAVLARFRPLLASAWLLDCISTFQIVDYRQHIVL